MRAGLSSPRPPFFRKYGCPFLVQWSGRVAVATDLVIAIQIGVTGFEPATSWSQTTRSTKLSYTPQCSPDPISCAAIQRIPKVCVAAWLSLKNGGSHNNSPRRPVAQVAGRLYLYSKVRVVGVNLTR